jgi:cobalt/nickel transport protein
MSEEQRTENREPRTEDQGPQNREPQNQERSTLWLNREPRTEDRELGAGQAARPFSLATVLVLLLVVILLAVLPLLFIRDSEFGGADGVAQQAITQIAPDYQPWFTPLIEPPGTETASLLFALQAALGAGVIGYFFGLKRGQRTKK